MFALIYFDTEDFCSPPDSPVHLLPGQLADVMRRHGLHGCFHIHGEKARFMERHAQRGVIDSIKWHDLSLHYDRGSIHPTTAEETSELEWFAAVERVLFREIPGFEALERIFGKCSGLTQHGGTFTAPIVYAAGRLGKPFFYSPFRLPGRNVVWFCNNLLIGGYQAPFYFDTFYRDTPKFEENLAKVNGYLDERAAAFDFTAMFGCHPVITMMQKFPDVLNFLEGATLNPTEWTAPTPVEGVSIPLILKNFERLIALLVRHPRVQWTTVAGIHYIYGKRPVRVRDEHVVAGAEAVLKNGGPTYTSALSAAELLFLLARRTLSRRDVYDVPQMMGPVEDAGIPSSAGATPDAGSVAREIVDQAFASGYLPPALSERNGRISPERALMLLACHALDRGIPSGDSLHLSADAIPGAAEAAKNVEGYQKWRIHGPRYHQDAILEHFRLQCWTLKPAFIEREYGSDVEIGRWVNPMFERP